MFKTFKKRYILPVIASGFLFVGVSFKDDFFEIAKQVEIFTTLFKSVNMNYVDQTNPAQLMDKAIKSMLAELDPYTVYFNEGDVQRFKINSTGEYTGIGAMISRKDGKMMVREVYKNYPADKAGLKVGDVITQIGDVSMSEYKEDATKLFRGSRNTKVDVKFTRQNESKTTQIILDEVDIKAVPFFGKIDDKTGYIVLTQFNAKASSETKEALEKLKDQGATQIVLDLRGNPGGLLQEAVNICNLFVPANEVIVTTKSKIEKHNNTYKTSKQPVDLEIPLAILVDGKSASASEIVAGALQDLDRAVVVGARSFGKGLVQRPVDLTYGTQLKVTISRYYTPAGRCIQALDYSKKDANGKAIKTDAKNYNAFKTKAGRTVYDGGGIQPDLEVTETKNNNVTEALIKNDIIFNYAVEYLAKNPSVATSFKPLTDTDFLQFKNYIASQKFSVDTKTELLLKDTWEQAKKDKLDVTMKASYDQLLATIKKAEDAEIDKSKAEILRELSHEIILQSQYKEGLYQYYLKNNIEIKKATFLLANQTEYKSILKK